MLIAAVGEGRMRLDPREDGIAEAPGFGGRASGARALSELLMPPSPAPQAIASITDAWDSLCVCVVSSPYSGSGGTIRPMWQAAWRLLPARRVPQIESPVARFVPTLSLLTRGHMACAVRSFWWRATVTVICTRSDPSALL